MENNFFSDISLNFKKFDLSFLSKLGKDRVKEVEGKCLRNSKSQWFFK